MSLNTDTPGFLQRIDKSLLYTHGLTYIVDIL